MRIDQLFADHDTGGIASLGCLGKRDTCAYQQRLDRSHRGVERARELGIGHPRQFPHQQRGTLLLRQAADVFDQPTEGIP
jgi:hypothetical protein